MTNPLVAELRDLAAGVDDTNTRQRLLDLVDRVERRDAVAAAPPSVMPHGSIPERVSLADGSGVAPPAGWGQTVEPAEHGVLTVVGLDPEQDIRARALDVASYLIGDANGTTLGVANHLIDLAEPLVAWISTGQRPS